MSKVGQSFTRLCPSRSIPSSIEKRSAQFRIRFDCCSMYVSNTSTTTPRQCSSTLSACGQLGTARGWQCTLLLSLLRIALARLPTNFTLSSQQHLAARQRSHWPVASPSHVRPVQRRRGNESEARRSRNTTVAPVPSLGTLPPLFFSAHRQGRARGAGRGQR